MTKASTATAATPYHSQAGSRRRRHQTTRTTRIARSSAERPAVEGDHGLLDGARDLARRRPREPGQQRPQPLLAEHLALAPRLDHAVGVEHQRVARRELGLLVVHAHLGEGAQDGARPPERLDLAPGPDHQRQGVARARHGRGHRRAADGEARVRDGREAVLQAALGDDRLVQALQGGARLGLIAGERAQAVAQQRGERRRLDPLAAHVADHRHAGRAGGEEVVEVAADLHPVAHGGVARGRLQAGDGSGRAGGSRLRCSVSAIISCSS